MEKYRKVVWAEGTMLAQQHFQCWDKQLQAEHRFDRLFEGEDNWGMAEFKLDEHLLAQGQFKIQNALMRFPDQRWFSYHQAYDAPLVRRLPELRQERITVCLGLCLADDVAGISGYEQAQRSEAVWQAEYEQVLDAYDHQRSREVLLAALRPAIFWQYEHPENVSLLPVAELIFNHQLNHYCLNEHFIPPLIRMAGIGSIQDFIQRSIYRIDAGIAGIGKMKSKQVSNDRDFLMLCRLSSLLCRHRAMLLSLERSVNTGPFQLYQCWISFLGELTGCLDEPLAEPAFVTYQHQNLTEIFPSLLQRFEDLFQRVVPADTASIDLQQQADGSWVSARISDNDLRQKRFCLAVYHEHADEHLIAKIQQQIKISAPGKLHSIVHSFSAGISISRMNTANGMGLTKRNYYYFQIEKQDKGWKEIIDEQKIAIFTGPALADASIELLVY